MGGGGAAAADAGSHVSSDVTTFQAQPNGVTRQRNRHGGSLDNSSDHGDVVTTTHTISEMRVRERRKRGRRSEKHVVVKMAVQHKSHRHDGDSDDDEKGDERGGHGTNGSNRNGQHDARNGGQGISIEEIDDDDESDMRSHARPTSEHSIAMNGANGDANSHLQITNVSDATVRDTMAQLLTNVERMKQYMYDHEQLFRRESEYVEQLQQENKALKTMAKKYKCRAREQKRVRRILREAKKKDDDHCHSRSSSNSSSSGKRKLKKQCKRLQQFQSELALRLEVVQSKNSVYELHVEKQLGDLRREYSDAYLFPTPFPFQ